MQNTISKALSALKKQVEVGLSHDPDKSALLNKIDRPVKIGDMLSRAETARDELRHTGCRLS